DFETMVGKHQDIIASSSYWGEQSFPSDNLNVIWRHGSLPLVFWSPWDKPYEEDRGPDKFALTEILAGKWDSYIDKWADAARDFSHPFIVVFGVEMNGTWFPWSGAYYGGAEWVAQYNNWKGPETYPQRTGMLAEMFPDLFNCCIALPIRHRRSKRPTRETRCRSFRRRTRQ